MKKYIFDKTKLKALLLSGVTLLSGVSCGKANTNTKKEEPQTSVVVEETTNNNVVTTINATNKPKMQQRNVTNNTDVLNETKEELEEREEQETEQKTEKVTEEKTEQETKEKATKEKQEIKTPSIGEHKVKSGEQTEKTQVTTTTTTKKITQTTQTTQTVTEPQTQQIVTEPPRTDYNKYDLLDPNPTIARMAYEKLSSDLCRELYNGYSFDGIYGVSTGYSESKVILAMINHDQNIAPEVLASDEALGKYSLDEILNYSHVLGFNFLEKKFGSRVDFNKYMLNEDLANYINTLNDAYVNGNIDECDRILDEYYSHYNTVEEVEDYVKYCYCVGVDYDTGRMPRKGLQEAEKLCEDVIARPMYDSYSQYIGCSYIK